MRLVANRSTPEEKELPANPSKIVLDAATLGEVGMNGRETKLAVIAKGANIPLFFDRCLKKDANVYYQGKYFKKGTRHSESNYAQKLHAKMD